MSIPFYKNLYLHIYPNFNKLKNNVISKWILTAIDLQNLFKYSVGIFPIFLFRTHKIYSIRSVTLSVKNIVKSQTSL